MNAHIKFAKTRPDAKIPSKRQGDGCYDLYVCFDEEFVTIHPHTVKLVPTGICSTFDSNYRIGFRERGSNTKSASSLWLDRLILTLQESGL